MQTFHPDLDAVRVQKQHLVQGGLDYGEYSLEVGEMMTELGRVLHKHPPTDNRLTREACNVALQQAMLLHERVPAHEFNQLTLDVMAYDWRKARAAHRAKHVVRANTRKHMETELGITAEDKAAEAALIKAEKDEVKAAKVLAAAQATGTAATLFGGGIDDDQRRRNKQREAKSLVDLAEAKQGQELYGASQDCIHKAFRAILTLLTEYGRKSDTSGSGYTYGSRGSSSSSSSSGSSSSSSNSKAPSREELKQIFIPTPDPDVERALRQQKLKAQQEKLALMPGIAALDDDDPPPPSAPPPMPGPPPASSKSPTSLPSSSALAIPGSMSTAGGAIALKEREVVRSSKSVPQPCADYDLIYDMRCVIPFVVRAASLLVTLVQQEMASSRLETVQEDLLREKAARMAEQREKARLRKEAAERERRLKEISSEIRAVAEHTKPGGGREKPQQYDVSNRGLGSDARHTTDAALAYRRASCEMMSGKGRAKLAVDRQEGAAASAIQARFRGKQVRMRDLQASQRQEREAKRQARVANPAFDRDLCLEHGVQSAELVLRFLAEVRRPPPPKFGRDPAMAAEEKRRKAKTREDAAAAQIRRRSVEDMAGQLGHVGEGGGGANCYSTGFTYSDKHVLQQRAGGGVKGKLARRLLKKAISGVMVTNRFKRIAGDDDLDEEPPTVWQAKALKAGEYMLGRAKQIRRVWFKRQLDNVQHTRLTARQGALLKRMDRAIAELAKLLRAAAKKLPVAVGQEGYKSRQLRLSGPTWQTATTVDKQMELDNRVLKVPGGGLAKK